MSASSSRGTSVALVSSNILRSESMAVLVFVAYLIIAASIIASTEGSDS